MDIHDFNHRYRISMRKLRRMDKDRVLRKGKSLLPPYWQMVRNDIHKGKLSARSIVLAYRFPNELEKIGEISRKQRSMIADCILKADLPKTPPPPASDGNMICLIVFCAATGEDGYLEKFIEILKPHIPEKSVDYYYLALRILLMCETQWQIDDASKNLRLALLKARADPAMQGWWHKEESVDSADYSIVYHRPEEPFDL